ncbi:MAG: IclR family transcriptional regulator [Pseudomonadota bacterium]
MKRDSNKSTTVLKALRVMETVSELDGHASANAVATAMKIDRATAYRMLKTLEDAGYLSMVPDTKAFQVTNRILALARPVLNKMDQTEWIDTILRAVTRRTGETCHYSEISGLETVLLRRNKGTQLVAVDFTIGQKCELHATSIGKAILAYQSPTFVDDYVKLEMRAYTDLTVTTADALRAELAKVRREGISYDLEELAEGMNCVAVPVRLINGDVRGGVSISGPKLRLTPDRLREIGEIMLEEVTAVSV